MKKIALFLFIIIVIMACGIAIFKYTNQSVVPQENLSQTSENFDSSLPVTNELLCEPKDIEALIELEPAAGNIYGTLTIKNISTKKCTVAGNKFVQMETKLTNLSQTNQGAAGETRVALEPEESMYSKVHYPNGAQCASKVLSGDISFSYAITSTQSVIFQDEDKETEHPIQYCSSQSEKTEVQVWSLSAQPVNSL